MNGDERERQIIRDAMKRLLDGDPMRSLEGKLTVKSLAVEANVKRWLLTLKHTDLKDEFYERVRLQNATPTAVRELLARISLMEKDQALIREALRDAREKNGVLARALAVLALESEEVMSENAQLQKMLEMADDSTVQPMRRRRGLTPGSVAPPAQA